MNSSDWLSPFAAIYGGATSLRNTMFDIHILRQRGLSAPVVSVGNITTGGTGKTPMVIHLARYLSDKGYKVGVISRGYGRKQKGIMEVLNSSSSEFGDEPSIIKASLPDIPVFVGASRVEVGERLLGTYSVDIVLADDAFQHRYLRRSMDIVLVDATQPLNHYRLLPSGRARESLESLKRATHLIFTKVNILGAHPMSELRDFFKPYVQKLVLENAVIAEYLIQSPQPLLESFEARTISSEPVTLVSGIGHPESFEKQCREQLGLSVSEHKVFRDHHEYKISNLQGLKDKVVVTTEKDRVKLLEIDFDFSNWFYVKLDVELRQGSERFYEELARLCS